MIKPAARSGSSLRVDGAAKLLTLRVPGREWLCTNIALTGEHQLDVRLERAGSPDRVDIRVVDDQRAPPQRIRLQRCSVTHRTTSDRRQTPASRAELSAMASAIADAVDQRLKAAPSASLVEALGRQKVGGRAVFGRDLLRGMLSPDVVEDTIFVDGWLLAGMYPSTHVDRMSGSLAALVLELRHVSGARLHIHVERRDDTAKAFARTSHFNLSYRAVGVQPASSPVARALIAFLLQLHDHDELEVAFPEVLADILAAPQLPAKNPTEHRDRWLNLSVLAECGQSCAFCSAKELAPPESDADTILARCLTDLVDGSARGIRQLRLNGYDPLAHPRVLEVIQQAKRLGYEHLWIYSPCTRLDDHTFCASLIDAAPERTSFNVPLYGADAETHDNVVGTPGAHARVMKALDNLIELAGAEAILVEIVVVRENLDGIGQLVAFAEARGLSFSCHLPFPITEARTDRFYTSAARQTRVMQVVAPLYGDERHFHVRGVAPCVAFRVLRSTGVPPKRWLPKQGSLLPGTQYRDDRYEHGAGALASDATSAATVRCPHSASCVLASACGAGASGLNRNGSEPSLSGPAGELLRSYVELYGFDEFQPVSLGELMDAI